MILFIILCVGFIVPKKSIETEYREEREKETERKKSEKRRKIIVKNRRERGF